MKLWWCDVETMGLIPGVDDLLEVAVATADLDHPFAINHVYHAVLELSDRGRMHKSLCGHDDFVIAMHTKNGLFDECTAKGKRKTRVIEDLLDLIPDIGDSTDKPVLAGASVHFDHGFLKALSPEVGARFSHRHYDVSAVKLFAQSLGMPKLPKAEAHRAIEDIDESVAHARAVAAWFAGWRG